MINQVIQSGAFMLIVSRENADDFSLLLHFILFKFRIIININLTQNKINFSNQLMLVILLGKTK